MIKKIWFFIKNLLNCFKKDDIKNLIKEILINNSYNLNHLKIIRLENKMANNNNFVYKTLKEIHNLQINNQNLKFNLKSIFLYIHILSKNSNDKVNEIIRNIKQKNYLKIKINNSKTLKFFLLKKGLFILLKRINEKSELFSFIIQNEFDIKNYSLMDKISLFLKIYDINIFQIVNQFIINPLNNINRDNNFKEVRDYYDLILKILRKFFKFLKNNIEYFIIDIYEKNEIESILCYEIYSEFISINKIWDDFYNIISEEIKLDLNIPKNLVYNFNKEENKKIEKFIYKLKNNDNNLKEISLFYYLEYSLSFFISRSIDEVQINKNQYEKFLKKNNIIISFMNIKQIDLKNKINEMNSMNKTDNQNFFPKFSKTYKNKINILNLKENTKKNNELNKEEIFKTNLNNK